MSAASLLTELSRLGVSVAGDGERLRYRGPREALTPALLGKLREHKAELLAALDQEARAIPILEIRTLVRTEAGAEVVEVTSGDSSHRRWEKRLCFGGACALVGEVTTDATMARFWVEAHKQSVNEIKERKTTMKDQREMTHKEVLRHCGGCPKCGGNNGGHYHTGASIFVCDKHKTQWCHSVGQYGLWRWRNMTDGERDADPDTPPDWRELDDYTYVEPVLSWPRR